MALVRKVDFFQIPTAISNGTIISKKYLRKRLLVILFVKIKKGKHRYEKNYHLLQKLYSPNH